MTTSQAPPIVRPGRGTAREALLDAAIDVIRARGYSATTVDGLCEAAGVTKGAFFHHFESKEALAIAAVAHWSQSTGALFATATYHEPADPIDRILAYLDFRAALIGTDPAVFSCLAGTMTQEVFGTHPDIRAACAASIFGHAGTLEADFQAALTATEAVSSLTAMGLALHTQVVLQGAFVLSKAADDPSIVLDSIAHLRRYFELLFLARNPVAD